MTYTVTILATIRNLKYAVTPSQLQDILLSQGVSIKKGTIKRILYRLWRRGQISRESRGLYFFDTQGDNINHQRGQKGTTLRVINHSKENKKISVSSSKKGQQKGLIEDQSLIPIQAQVFFIFWNNQKSFTLREIYDLVSSYRKSKGIKFVNYRTVQSAVYHFKMLGILGVKRRGLYYIKDMDLAERYFNRYMGRDTPQGPSTPLPGTIPLPTLKYTMPKIKGVIVPRDIFERVINQPPRIDPILMIKRPSEKDPAKQWRIETENVAIMIPERTMKATIYIKGPEWKTDLVDLFGNWIMIELQGKKWMTEAAINMKELLHFKTLQARVGDLKVSVDKSIFGEDYDLEFNGEVKDVNTAILSTLLGPAAFADKFSILENEVKNMARELLEMKSEFSMLKLNDNTPILEKRLNDLDDRLTTFGDKLNKLDHKIEVIAGGILKLIEQKPAFEEVEGYA